MKPITCKECEKMIAPFLDERLRGPEIYQFKDHIEHCESCKEELTIEYLSSEGIVHLESGTSFHLEKELTGYMNRAISYRKRVIWCRIALLTYEAAALLIILGTFIYAAS